MDSARWAVVERDNGLFHEAMTDSHTLQMLDAFPADVPVGAAELATAIAACLTCVQACTACADSDLIDPNVATLRACVAINLVCAEVCRACLRACTALLENEVFPAPGIPSAA